MEHTPHWTIESILSITCLAGLALNAVTALSYWRRTSCSKRGLALAWCLANSLSLACTPLLVLTMHGGSWPAGELCCRLYMALSTGLGPWGGAWLLVGLTARLLPLQRPLPCSPWPWLAPLLLLLVTPTLLVFSYTSLVHAEATSRCMLGISTYSDHLWVCLVGFVLSYHTPLLLAACLLGVAWRMGRDRRFGSSQWRRALGLHAGLLLAQGALWGPHWLVQLRLLLLDEEEEADSLETHLVAGWLSLSHAALAAPLLLLALAHRSLAGLSRQGSSVPPQDAQPSHAEDLQSEEGLLMDTSRRSSFNILSDFESQTKGDCRACSAPEERA